MIVGSLGDGDRAGHELGRRLGRRRDLGQPVEGADEPHRIEGRRVGRPRAGEPRGVGGAGLAAEEPDPRRTASSARRSAGVPVRPVEQQSCPELGLGVGAFVGERQRIGRIRAAREHRPALDQDELAGDGHERADVAQPVRRQPS